MAKKNNPYILFLIGTGLLSAGWVMKSFPLLIFTGIAPLFAITDLAKPEKSFWNFFELILLALSISLFAAHLFETKYLVSVLVQSIILTLAFVGYSFTRQRLGSWVGKPCIVLFWLGLEYIFLKVSWTDSTLFLGDALSLKMEWLRWNQYTGYLGATMWILLCNLILYYSFLKDKISIAWMVVYFLIFIGPIVYSYTLTSDAIHREEMIALYESSTQLKSGYAKYGEYIPRTAGWISGLILIFATLKTNSVKND